jgi:hypothetical protein
MGRKQLTSGKTKGYAGKETQSFVTKLNGGQ